MSLKAIIYIILIGLPSLTFARTAKFKITPMNSDGCVSDIHRDVCEWDLMKSHLEKCEPSILDKQKSIGVLDVTIKDSSPKDTEDLLKRAIEATGRKVLP